MNILYLTMTQFGDGTGHGIYHDLMRRFVQDGHEVYVVFPLERGSRHVSGGFVRVSGGCMNEHGGLHILGVRTLKVQKTNIIEKGIGQVLIEPLFKNGIKRNFGGVKFDIITYSTPPITLAGPVKWVKKRNPEAMTYLQLKDIFPQNAVDLGMLPDRFGAGQSSGDDSEYDLQGGSGGMSGSRRRDSFMLKWPVNFAKYLLYRSFRRKEKQLYRISDWIGCMSPANVKYVIGHNPEVQHDKVEICPNSMAEQFRGNLDNGGEASSLSSVEERAAVRLKYGLPQDKPVFFYGGNLGKPQGIPFLIECLKAISRPSSGGKDYRGSCHFLIVGDGVDFSMIKSWHESEHPLNVTLLKSLPKEDYDSLAASCDVGMIFLDWRFTIPNYPSRLLSCLMNRKPIIACTDSNSDIGPIAENNGYGYWCPSNSVEAFTLAVDRMLQSDVRAMGERGYQFYLNNYTVDHSYNAMIRHLPGLENRE